MSLLHQLRIFLTLLFTNKKSPLWKMANVTPLPKDSIISDFNKDLRPISLTSTLSKIAESIIERGLKSHILKLIDPCQFGFFPWFLYDISLDFYDSSLAT